jgi:hypothetical protein
MIIDHKDTTKQVISINDKSYDTSTSVVIHGSHTVNYGYDLQSGLLHLLEHFCGDIEPYNSIPGQLWYDRLNDRLNVNTNNGYVELGYTRPPVLPDNATTSDILQIRLENLLSVNGGTMRGPLILKDISDTEVENAAVSKRYIDSKSPSAPVGLIAISGNDEPAGRLIINDIPTDYTDSPMIAANKNYVDRIIPSIDIVGPTSVTAQDNSIGKNTIVTFHQSNLTYIYGQHTLSNLDNNGLYSIHIMNDATIKSGSVQINILDSVLGEKIIVPSPSPTPSPSPSISGQAPAPSEPPGLPTSINANASGGDGITENKYIVYKGGGTLNVNYDMYSAADQMEVLVNGVVIDYTKNATGVKGLVSGQGKITLSGSQLPNYANITVRMSGGGAGSVWTYSLDYTNGIQSVSAFSASPAPTPSPSISQSAPIPSPSPSIIVTSKYEQLPTISGIVRNIGDSFVLDIRYFGKSNSSITFDYAITGMLKIIPKTTKSYSVDPLSLLTADQLAAMSISQLANLKGKYNWTPTQLSKLSNEQLAALGIAMITLDTTLVNSVTPTIGGYIGIANVSALTMTINNITYKTSDIKIDNNRWSLDIPAKNSLVVGSSYGVTYNLNNGADVSLGNFSVSASADIILIDPSDNHKFVVSHIDGDSHGTWDECVTFNTTSNASKLGGHSDWRLPSKSELQTIFNNLATIKVDNTFAPYKYWANDSTAKSAWCINYGTGVINECQKQYSNFVRLVRNA